MIKYRPVRKTPTASIKDEMTFASMEELLSFLKDRSVRFSSYIGKHERSEIRIDDAVTEDPITCWKNIRMVYDEKTCIGYCGE